MADTDLPEADFYRVIQATTGLKLKEIREIQDVFDYFDTDHDGSLTKEQAVMAWKTFGILIRITTVFMTVLKVQPMTMLIAN